ncbi:hypothetical protein M407DRAFT_195067 [Tulasnella calospora MUT 4182]|uniref:Uncharacterized protein n=1 Tax=Tulasnella calospora MUT 4182 TaxID=1051891 RepID=A0A0C3L014_9AGAM|nr:hypothetical protein M407DRAFT_195067 [Tulasnella calospora MUT 4182]
MNRISSGRRSSAPRTSLGVTRAHGGRCSFPRRSKPLSTKSVGSRGQVDRAHMGIRRRSAFGL